MAKGEVDPTFGIRVRDMRIERNLSQGGLASLLPPRHHPSWISKIEKGEQEPDLADLRSLSEALNVNVSWLVSGEKSGDSEFVARLRGMEGLLDERGQRAVMATAEREVEESMKRAAAQTEAEAEMLRLFRDVSPEQRDLLLGAARRAVVQRQGRPSERQERQDRQARTA